MVAGCQSEAGSDPVVSTPRSESKIDHGWKEVTNSGFAISFPPDWDAIDLRRPDVAKACDDMFGTGPDAHKLKKVVMDRVAKENTLYATDLGSGSCSVYFLDLPNLNTLEKKANAMKQFVKQTAF